MFPGGSKSTEGSQLSGGGKHRWKRQNTAGGIPRRRVTHRFRPGDYNRGFELLESRQLLSGDLTQEIAGLLDNGTTTGSVTLSDVTLGSFLSSSSVTVSFQNISESGLDWSGTVSVSAATASIAIGQEFSGQIQGDGTAGSQGLTGSYTLNDQAVGQGSYALAVTDLSASVPNVLSASASDVQLQYDPGGSSSQEIAQVGSLSATIIPFDNAQVSLSNLDIYENGFTLGNATVSAGSFTLGDFLTVDNPSLSFSNVAYTDGAALAGTIGIAIGTATLFPNQSSFTATVDGFTGSYDLDTSELTLGATDVNLAIGQILAADATGLTFDYNPSASVPLTIGASSISLTSPDFPGLSATATNLQASNAGFSLDRATLTAPSSVTLGGFLEADGLTVTATDLDYQTNPPSGQQAFGGTIGISATSVALFPGKSAFTATVDGFAGSYDLNTSELMLSADDVNLSIGQILKADATGLAIDYSPSASVPLTVDASSISLTSPDFPGLSATATNLQASNAGFSLDSATLTAPSSVTLGGFLEADGLTVTASDLSYQTNPASGQDAFGGTIGISATSVALFPGKSAFTATVDGFTGSYDLNTSELMLAADDVNLSIGQILKADATGLAIDYNPSATVPLSVDASSISLTSPDFPGLSATATNLQASNAGFSLDSATLTAPSSVTLGGFLEADGLTVTATDLDYQTNPPSGQQAFGGTIGISATSVALFPGKSAFTATVDGFTGSYDLNTSELMLVSR